MRNYEAWGFDLIIILISLVAAATMHEFKVTFEHFFIKLKIHIFKGLEAIV